LHKLWLVALHEYRKRVQQRSFLVAMLGIPVLIVVISAISILVSLGGADARPIGYVDEAGILNPNLLSELTANARNFTELAAYPDSAGARAALEAGEIQGFYVVPANYLEEKRLSLVYWEDAPVERVRRDFGAYLRASLLDEQPAGVASILDGGLNLVVRSRDARREVSEGNVLGLLLPFVVTFFLFFAVSTAGGYLLQAITEEKENRVVEIITTSISPEQLMGGKALGLMAVSLTQILVWTLALSVGVIVAIQFMEEIGPLAVPWPLLGITALFFVPTFLLIAGIMTSIGAMSTELQQAQQISGIVNLLFMVPMFFVAVIFAAPNSPFLILLTLFPTTAFLTILLRWSLTFVPSWQMILSWVLLVTTALISLWLASRIFRMGMLRYGQRLSLKHVATGLRERRIALEEETSPHA
jgi:ABC-2 type transport system permease protein